MTISDCIHGLTPSTCSFCRSKGSRTVFFSAGGRKFHYDIECKKFHEGRQQVLDRNGVTAPIESGPEYTVQRERDRCRTCVPRKNN
jgi:hypothetical protein